MGAWLEISTVGECKNKCQFCPQDVLKKAYTSKIKKLSLDNFKKAVDKLPENSAVCFSGFVDPCLNPNVSDMILYAHEKGFKVYLLTTLIGWSIEEYVKVKDILDYLSIHLPDNDGKTVINIRDTYIELLEYIVTNPPPNAEFLFNHHSGEIHEKIKDKIPYSYLLDIHDRGGLLDKGIKSVHPNAVKCGHSFLFTHEDGGSVLLPNGDCVTCCNSFNLEENLGNLFTQSWDDIKKNIKPIELCKKCICGVE
jgi:sulfatase maturation enzyme AslB (radical SAM superfamily)